MKNLIALKSLLIIILITACSIAKAQTSVIAVNLIYNQAGTDVLADGVLASLDPSNSNLIDDNDAIKMPNPYEGIAIDKNPILLGMEQRQMPGNNDSIFLKLSNLTRPQYKLQIFTQNMAGATLRPWLFDKYLNTVSALSITDTNTVLFNTSSSIPASIDPNRFRLVFKAVAFIVLPIIFSELHATEINKNLEVEWTISQEPGIIRYEIEHSIDGVHFKRAGTVAYHSGNNLQSYNFLHRDVVSGNNYYRVKVILVNGNVIISKTVMERISGVLVEFATYPNPVIGQNLNIHFANIVKGDYQVAVVNGIGGVVTSTIINHQGGTTTYPIKLPNFSTGNYTLRINSDLISYSQIVIVK